MERKIKTLLFIGGHLDGQRIILPDELMTRDKVEFPVFDKKVKHIDEFLKKNNNQLKALDIDKIIYSKQHISTKYTDFEFHKADGVTLDECLIKLFNNYKDKG